MIYLHGKGRYQYFEHVCLVIPSHIKFNHFTKEKLTVGTYGYLEILTEVWWLEQEFAMFDHSWFSDKLLRDDDVQVWQYGEEVGHKIWLVF
jgi:hypothetical protein